MFNSRHNIAINTQRQRNVRDGEGKGEEEEGGDDEKREEGQGE
jgi:hypothetical protein